MPSRNKKIKERVKRMSNAWAQGAANVTFKGITRTGFDADIKATDDEEQAIADMQAQVKIRQAGLDTKYAKLNDDSIKIRDGVEGHEDFGNDHPILEAMGFVRSSQRKSGLKRGSTKAPTK
jgi:hypothetical protein